MPQYENFGEVCMNKQFFFSANEIDFPDLLSTISFLTELQD